MTLEIKKQVINITQDGRMSMNDAALYLGIHPVTLRINYQKESWPHYVKLGSRISFFKKDLDNWVKSYYSKNWKVKPYPAVRKSRIA